MPTTSDLKPKDLLNQEVVFQTEGGAVYRASSAQGEPCLLIDETALSDFLAAEDLEHFSLQKVLAFVSESEREAFIGRRWPSHALNTEYDSEPSGES